MYQDYRWCKYVEIRKIMGGLVHNVREYPVHLDKVQFAPKAPICSKSSRLHQKFPPTQMHPIKCTESFSERSKSSHLHQKFPIVLTLFFNFFCELQLSFLKFQSFYFCSKVCSQIKNLQTISTISQTFFQKKFYSVKHLCDLQINRTECSFPVQSLIFFNIFGRILPICNVRNITT